MVRALIVAAHPDDELLGCGGMMSMYRKRGDAVQTIFLAGGRDDSRNLSLYSIGVCNIADTIAGVLREFRPDTVYIHSSADLSTDHRVAREAALVACRPFVAPFVRRILAFEVLSSTDLLRENMFVPNYYVDIEEHLDEKCRALEELYGHELRTPPHPRSLEAVRALAAFRGIACGMLAAEAFEIVLMRD